MGPWRDVVGIGCRMHHGSSCDKTRRRSSRPAANCSPRTTCQVATAHRRNSFAGAAITARSASMRQPKTTALPLRSIRRTRKSSSHGRMSMCACGAWATTRGGSSRLTRSIRRNPRVLRAVGMLLHNLGELDKASSSTAKRSRSIRPRASHFICACVNIVSGAISRRRLRTRVRSSPFRRPGSTTRRAFSMRTGSFAISASSRCLSVPIATGFRSARSCRKGLRRGGRCRAFGACARRTGAFPRLLRPAQGRRAARPHRGGA